jgi:NTP pyrophosphatase (non-canonical NTP hydrolase)
MKIEEMQNKAVEAVGERLNRKGITPCIDLTMTHLMEEIGEIARQINNGKLKRKEVDIQNIGEEISDSIILLALLASQYNINLEKVLTDKINSVHK